MSLVRSAILLLASGVIFGQQQSGRTETRRDAQFERVVSNYSISRWGPYYYIHYYHHYHYRIGSGTYTPTSYGWPGPGSAYPPPQYGAVSSPYVWPPAQGFDSSPAVVPSAITREEQVTLLILTAGLRALLFVTALALILRVAPKRVWTEVLDGNNIALAILLGATAIALGIVIASPVR